jgi:hypothetical protein
MPANDNKYLFSGIRILPLLVLLITVACSPKSSSRTVVVVKPKYHRSWYKDYTHKKKWHIGRIVRFYPEKQGVKKVKMKN